MSNKNTFPLWLLVVCGKKRCAAVVIISTKLLVESNKMQCIRYKRIRKDAMVGSFNSNCMQEKYLDGDILVPLLPFYMVEARACVDVLCICVRQATTPHLFKVKTSWLF